MAVAKTTRSIGLLNAPRHRIISLSVSALCADGNYRRSSPLRKRSTTLTLTLKRKWFDLIKSGVKLEEYREMKECWYKRLCREKNSNHPWLNPLGSIYFEIRKDFKTLVFTLGYPRADDIERRLVFKNPRIRISKGNPEWGAEPGKEYFVITWSK